MPSIESEMRSLFPKGGKNAGTKKGLTSVSAIDSTSSSSGAEDDDDDDCSEQYHIIPVNGGGGGGGGGHGIFESRAKSRSPDVANRRRHHLHRGVRRFGRIFVGIIVLSLVFLVYLPVTTNEQTRYVPLPDWGYNTSRNIADYVLPDVNTTLVEPHDICQEKVFLMIVVCSSVQNFAERQAIRETWGNLTEFNYGIFSKLHAHLQDQYLKPSQQRLKIYSEFLGMPGATSANRKATVTMPRVIPVRIVFLIGRNKYESLMGNETIARIRSESEQYNDIVQENFIDTYNNLTVKSVLALKWVKHRCLHQSAFFMKCDDDTFVNIPNLLHFLLGGTIPVYNDTLEFYDVHTAFTLATYNRLNHTSNYLVGHLFCSSRPVANVTSKWYMPYYMYTDDKYPKYLSGAGYLMSMDVVPQLYDTALNTTLIYLEDVYITGMCAERMRLQPRHHPLFGYTRSRDLCSFKGTITQHNMADDSMTEAYAFVMNMSNRCPPPGKFFRSIRLRKNFNCV